MNKSELLPIEQRVRSLLCDHLDRGDKLIVGVSGGADSVALVTMLARMEWPVHAVHINYQARGADSDADQEFVELLCEHLQVPLHVEQAPKHRAIGNFQDWAREQRYTEFRALLDDLEAAGIAVAHHREDQLETVLQKIMRGAGPDRWRGMDIWNGEIIRPLLQYNKSDLLQYLDHLGQRYRTDASNLETGYARNFLRHEWMPDLNRLFPGWQQNILRLSEYSSQYEEAIGWAIEQATHEGQLHREQWMAMSDSLRKAVLYHWLREELDGPIISNGQLATWSDNLPEMQVGQYLAVSDRKGIWVERDGFRVGELPDPIEKPVVVTVKRDHLPISGALWTLAEDTLAPVEWMDHLCVDADKLDWPLRLREWRPGDRIQPLGMEGEKKISDVLTDAKVAPHDRAKAKVILTFEETICAVIFPPIQNRPPAGVIAEPYKCDSETETCLVIHKTDSNA
jgi:tRNA(Ile)-lysidine synthase